ncbi:hypothetical protein [Leptospira kirschneri]|uniref:PF13262 family protein n=1 Tax=Leptospira kirschneri serovar Bulgarica str. Nikolaevo TaxID=1240687 RepID=M6F6W7_9LEPT|nr:hypothetical protein [Leptospira kirschneri]EMK22425.1 hypothetical protein LEP1GSC008_1588 [Leptospira kirschneri serovar Bulgarica str. Nikolaevo]EMK24498.1 hypothetical protein LEP1GSC008_2661 [Leptospira kirschneri serovar Bulgarica str. Nikolaevo]EMK24908.1 hypothetical protein LEP1GSC008_0569 [Leptospira kirschneri serovar Bulgarica str. Nikolaevo]
MPRASIAQLRAYVGDPIADLTDPELQLFLDDAVASVIDNTSLSESHPRFNELQRARAAYLLFNANRMKNEVMAESADGISRNYDTNISPGMQVSWLDLYNQKRTEILGFKGRVL